MTRRESIGECGVDQATVRAVGQNREVSMKNVCGDTKLRRNQCCHVFHFRGYFTRKVDQTILLAFFWQKSKN